MNLHVESRLVRSAKAGLNFAKLRGPISFMRGEPEDSSLKFCETPPIDCNVKLRDPNLFLGVLRSLLNRSLLFCGVVEYTRPPR